MARKKPEWPEENASTVSKYANRFDHEGALGTLDMIRDELFGDSETMEALARQWGSDNTMTDSGLEIQRSSNELAGYWQGGGYDAYTKHEFAVRGLFGNNETQMNGISDVMLDCVELIYGTYADALRFISSCAHDLVSFSLADLIPGAGTVVKIIQVLNDFVKNVSDLVAAAIEKMGTLMVKKGKLTTFANDFSGLGTDSGGPLAPPGAAGNPDAWNVKPIEA
ncbi:hypothetical protein HUO13_00415 [Saccharopolyspora erythraea]|uniref:hypothetical protein n=1 Tax=Saccharopolyspora erythraea TaxID=1836 RepID=UPI001BAA900D|nr:hypothetical protein [Saccharopolyspora erythraea]QUG99466.1 hypothetical protein HUO13_00415 [Saccharopolyspora erythraea]